MRLFGKIAIITGGGSGIGRETALQFVKEHACVVVADISEDLGKDTVKMVLAESPNNANCISFFKCDVSKSDQVKALIDYTIMTYGKVNVIFNNAEIMMSKDSTVVDTDDYTFDRTIDVNLKGVFYGCKYGIPALRKSGGGVIINGASFSGIVGSAYSRIAYATSKGAIISMSKELAATHAKENIRVIPLCPGPLKTNLLMKFLDTPAKKQRHLIHLPLGRFGTTIEIAKTVVFLASDEASYITGTPFMVDGGRTSTYITAE